MGKVSEIRDIATLERTNVKEALMEAMQTGGGDFGKMFEIWDNLISVARANGCSVEGKESFIREAGDFAEIYLEYRGAHFKVTIQQSRINH